MPYYEFCCDNCNYTFDEKVSAIDIDAYAATCPNCGKMETHRVYSCNFVLKGAGWPGKELGSRKSSASKECTACKT